MRDLFSGYYNLDWQELHSDPWALLAEFTEHEPEKLQPLLGDIRTALRVLPTEADLRDLMDSLMCGYNPLAFGSTYREWLTAVAERIEQALAAGTS